MKKMEKMNNIQVTDAQLRMLSAHAEAAARGRRSIVPRIQAGERAQTYGYNSVDEAKLDAAFWEQTAAALSKPNSDGVSAKDTIDWFKEAVPNPTGKTFNVQLGVHLEEICEMLEACELVKNKGFHGYGVKVMSEAWFALKNASLALKSGEVQVTRVNHLKMLDALCDQRVTATGLAYMLGYDWNAAVAEVDRSNFSKFVDGKAIFHENGKIAKGPDYKEPSLLPMVQNALNIEKSL